MICDAKPPTAADRSRTAVAMRAEPLDQAHALDDLLIRWHAWRNTYTPARGFNGRALVCGDYVTSRQYDDINGAIDDVVERSRMKALEFEISELPPVLYAAICVIARALSVGCMVFMSPRLPADRAERDAVLKLARQALTRRALAAGLL